MKRITPGAVLRLRNWLCTTTTSGGVNGDRPRFFYPEGVLNLVRWRLLEAPQVMLQVAHFALTMTMMIFVIGAGNRKTLDAGNGKV